MEKYTTAIFLTDFLIWSNVPISFSIHVYETMIFTRLNKITLFISSSSYSFRNCFGILMFNLTHCLTCLCELYTKCWLDERTKQILVKQLNLIQMTQCSTNAWFINFVTDRAALFWQVKFSLCSLNIPNSQSHIYVTPLSVQCCMQYHVAFSKHPSIQLCHWWFCTEIPILKMIKLLCCLISLQWKFLYW